MSNDATPAIILSMFDTGVAAARSLGRHGIPVLGFDPDPTMPGMKSRYCRAAQCPDPLTQPDELLAFLEAQAAGWKSHPVLFPASDAFVSFVSDHRQSLSRLFLFNLPESKTIKALLSKYEQAELAQSAGLEVPLTLRLQSKTDFASAGDGMHFPAFIKPVYIHRWRSHFQNKGFRVNDLKEFSEVSEIIIPTSQEVVVQEIIPGPVTNNFEVSLYIDMNGRVCHTFTARKWRQYPRELGVGTLVESIREPSLEAKAVAFCGAIGMRGFANIEFKFDERDGKPKYIELNARLWQQNALADICGLNFPLAQYDELVNHKEPLNRDHKTGVKWWDPMSDFQSFVEGQRDGTINLSDWLTSLKGVRSYSLFASDDIMPGIHSLEYGLKIVKLPLYLWKGLNSTRKGKEHHV